MKRLALCLKIAIIGGVLGGIFIPPLHSILEAHVAGRWQGVLVESTLCGLVAGACAWGVQIQSRVRRVEKAARVKKGGPSGDA